MLASVVSYLIALVTFVVVDMGWLGVMASRFYKPILGDIAIAGVNLPPAAIFYATYPIGLVIFAIEPALRSGSWLNAPLYGAFFGFFTYATYDLSNQATLRNWTSTLSAVDVVWGTFLGAVTAAITFWVINKLMPTG